MSKILGIEKSYCSNHASPFWLHLCAELKVYNDHITFMTQVCAWEYVFSSSQIDFIFIASVRWTVPCPPATLSTLVANVWTCQKKRTKSWHRIKLQQTSSILLSDDSWAELALRLAMSNMCIVPEGMKSSDGHLLELGATLGDLQCMNLLSRYTWELPQIHQVFLVACRAPFFIMGCGGVENVHCVSATTYTTGNLGN